MLSFKEFLEKEELTEIFRDITVPAIVRKQESGEIDEIISIFYHAVTKIINFFTASKEPPVYNLTGTEKLFDNPNFINLIKSIFIQQGGTDQEFNKRLARMRQKRGNVGIAYLLDPIVIKITRDKNEAELAQLLKNKPEFPIFDIVWAKDISAFVIINKMLNVKIPQELNDAVNIFRHYLNEVVRHKTSLLSSNLTQDSINYYNKKFKEKLTNVEQVKPYINILANIINKIYKYTGRLWHDLKTGNIGVDEQGNPIPFDFGFNTIVTNIEIPKIRMI